MRASVPRHRRPAFLLLCSGLGLAVALVVGTARADNPDTLQREADQLRAQNADLDEGAAQALLELYALESSLQRAEQRRASLEGRIAESSRSNRPRRVTASMSPERPRRPRRRRLRTPVRALYVEGKPEPLEVILGASSLDELIDAIDSVNRLADHDEQIITQVQDARRDLRVALRELAERQEELTRLAGAAEAALPGSSSPRREGRVSDLAQAAGGAQRPPDRIADRAGAGRRGGGVPDRLGRPRSPRGDGESAPEPSAPAPTSTDSSPEPGRQVTVSATKYCLTGTTATGLPVQYGVIATDPAYIPLGTRLFVPGYGEGVAADTGGAVTGWTIDLWVSSCAEADAYGRQNVTITIYD